jgi:hypothetical protein
MKSNVNSIVTTRRQCSKCDDGGCGEVVSTVLFSMFCVVEN